MIRRSTGPCAVLAPVLLLIAAAESVAGNQPQLPPGLHALPPAGNALLGMLSVPGGGTPIAPTCPGGVCNHLASVDPATGNVSAKPSALPVSGLQRLARGRQTLLSGSRVRIVWIPWSSNHGPFPSLT